ncbi:MAG: hypothetical protein ABR605_04410, partial [Desulfurivibrionaceae bacterium]
ESGCSSGRMPAGDMKKRSVASCERSYFERSSFAIEDILFAISAHDCMVKPPGTGSRGARARAYLYQQQCNNASLIRSWIASKIYELIG